MPLRRLLPALVLLLGGCLGAVAPTEPVEPASSAGGFSSTSVFAGDYALDEGFSRVLAPGTARVLDPELHEFASPFDGANVQIGLVRPDVPHAVPVIVAAGPYFWDVSPGAIESTFEWKRLVENFVPHGYAVALVPIRGTADAGGCIDLMGPAERADVDAAVTWLGTQPWSNGNVGMIGLSYTGSTAWEVASVGNPHLKTIVPIAGVNSFGHLMFPNGTSEQRGTQGRMVTTYYVYNWWLSFLDAADDPVTDGPWDPTARRPAHVASSVVCPEAARGYAASVASGLTGSRDPLGYWAARDTRPGVLANYGGSVFHVQGLRDTNVDPSHNYPFLHALEAEGVVVKHLLGQWEHRWPDRVLTEDDRAAARLDFSEILLHWFDRWLKDDATRDLGPRVQVQDSSGLWRDEADWPPADSEPVEFWLAPDGTMSTSPSSASGSAPVAFGDRGEGGLLPRTCPACPTFRTAPFEEEFRFAGIPHVHLTVAPSAPTQEIAASLHVVEGDVRRLVGWGQIDVAYADGGEDARPATPGEPLLVRMVLDPLDVAVPAGAALELEVHGANAPERLPGAPPAPARLDVGGEKSVLRVLAFERGPEAFFVPPGG